MYPSLTRFPGDLFADFDKLQRQIEQLFGLRGWPSSIRAGDRGGFPAINMGTTEEAVEIYAFVPGIDPDQIAVSVDKGLLTIEGQRDSDLPREAGQASIYARERFAGGFHRAVTLPEDVDTGGVDASYRNGVLKIVVPKRESAKPRRIAVTH